MAIVLVADDDPITRELVVFRLESEGHQCVAVPDGTSALAAADERVPDIAVLDVNMPGMSGFDLCRELHSKPATARLPVIMLTASVQEADVAEGFDSGADDYVAKPFNPRELSNRVRAVLDRAGWTSDH